MRRDGTPIKGHPSVYLLAGNRLLRETLNRLLKKRGLLNVCGVSPYSPGIVQSVAAAGAEVLILDSVLPYPQLYKFISEAMTDLPELKVILIDMANDPHVFLDCVRVGAVGYILEDASASEVVSGVQAVIQGRAICPPHFFAHLFRAISKSRHSTPSARIRAEKGLTRRQQQLIPLIAKGMTNKEIAMQMNLSEQTIKNHVHGILRRVGVNDRLQIADIARDF